MANQVKQAANRSQAGVDKASLWSRGVVTGDWLSWDRIGFACLCSAIGFTLGLLWMLVVPNTYGAPNGTLLMDYLSFWMAGGQALNGTPEVAYSPAAFSALQQQYTGTDTVFGFFYPPHVSRCCRCRLRFCPTRSRLPSLSGSPRACCVWPAA